MIPTKKISLAIGLGALIVIALGFKLLRTADKQAGVAPLTSASLAGEGARVPCENLSNLLSFQYLSTLPDGSEVNVAASRKADKWTLEKPVELDGDPVAIAAFLEALASIPTTEPPLERANWHAVVGDAQPSLTVTMQFLKVSPPAGSMSEDSEEPKATTEADVEGDEAEVTPEAPPQYRIGFTEVDNKVYVTSGSSDSFYVVTPETLTSFRRQYADFMVKHLISIDEATLRNLTLKGKGREQVDLVRSANGFDMIRPQTAAASAPKIHQLLGELGSLQYTSVSIAPPEDLVSLFDEPDYTVVWETSSGAATSLQVVETENTLYAAYRPHRAIFEIPMTFREQLKMAPEVLLGL